jgi:hypothetical protein
MPSSPPLTDTEKRVLDLIKSQPQGTGVTGSQIVTTLSNQNYPIEQSTLTRHIIPKLKQWYGVKNRPGVGYYIDQT